MRPTLLLLCLWVGVAAQGQITGRAYQDFRNTNAEALGMFNNPTEGFKPSVWLQFYTSAF